MKWFAKPDAVIEFKREMVGDLCETVTLMHLYRLSEFRSRRPWRRRKAAHWLLLDLDETVLAPSTYLGLYRRARSWWSPTASCFPLLSPTLGTTLLAAWPNISAQVASLGRSVKHVAIRPLPSPTKQC